MYSTEAERNDDQFEQQAEQDDRVCSAFSRKKKRNRKTIFTFFFMHGNIKTRSNTS